MTARVRNITFDCADPYRLAGFWSQVTGYRDDPEDPNRPEDEEAALVGPDGQANLLFIRVPEAKTLAGSLVGGAGLAEDPSLTGSSLTLVLGPGFSGVRVATAGGDAGGGAAKPKPARPKPPGAELREYDPRPC